MPRRDRQPGLREEKTGLRGVAERLVVVRKPGNSGGAKGPCFKGDAESDKGQEGLPELPMGTLARNPTKRSEVTEGVAR